MAENQQNSIYSKIKEYLVIISIFIGIPIFWLLAAGLIYSSLTYFIVFDADKDIWAVRGTFGDSFGAVNGLFTGLAFAGTLYAIWLQRKDLAAQQEANEKQGSEINDQTKAIAEQTKSIANELEETKKQTKELTRQIQLSIMPGFVVVMKIEKVQYNFSGPQTGGVTRSEMRPKHKFDLVNIGNGTAVNIEIESIELTRTELIAERMKIEFDHISYMVSKTPQNVDYKVLRNTNNDWSFFHPINDPTERNLIDFLYRHDQPNLLFTLKINFFDIENNEYTQEITVEKNKIIPKPVIPVKKV